VYFFGVKVDDIVNGHRKYLAAIKKTIDKVEILISHGLLLEPESRSIQSELHRWIKCLLYCCCMDHAVYFFGVKQDTLFEYFTKPNNKNSSTN
jgi:hypothetical protein